jgi:hypothetical protein
LKTKCQIIPVNEYDHKPIVFEDDNNSYTIGRTGHLTRLRRKTCSLCASSTSYVVISEYPKHKRVERFCREHASKFGELPPTPDPIVEQKLKITKKQKLALQRWTNIKVNI